MDGKNTDISKATSVDNKIKINLKKIIENKASSIKQIQWPNYPSSSTGGVIPMNLESKFSNERHRLSKFFNDKWRNWRIQYNESLKLHKSEPSLEAIAAIEKETTNIFLRIWRYPFNLIENKVFAKFTSLEKAHKYRKKLHRYFVGYLFLSYLTFKLTYKSNNWETKQGLIISCEKPAVYPNDHRYPLINPRPFKEQFFDNGFSKRTVYLNGVKG